jgi:hypothetical protein
MSDFNNKWLNGEADRLPTKNVRIRYISRESGEKITTGIMPRKTAEKYLNMYHCGVIVDDDNGGN